ncbi:hypothetical protein HDC90_004165 [Pedobacter sp. AK013]|uniref:M57 family metalloprotease n=1 Tax=Pedobacter sp. AK013 TaxID=2723071 RepID=UPI00161C3680|nr:M57 family metalloprotease [Pedobacter sp. AK013]MBB6239512.1 hypothetical protein [Pedobacter sp. AK013]
MKNLKINALKIVIVMVIGLITITSCKKENLTVEKETVLNTDEQLYNLIINSGVKSENIKDVGEYYLVEGDMLFKKNKSDLKKVSQYLKGSADFSTNLKQSIQMSSPGSIPGKISQWRTIGIISSHNVENIKVYYDSYPNPYGAPWSSAWKVATENWQNIPNCKISFYNDFNNKWTNQYTDNAITIIEGVPLYPSSYAYAEFPSSDNAGYSIHINTNVSLSEGQKIFVLSHELGHCLGFRHTNWQSDWREYNAPEGAIQIPGTPATDPSSIMNNGSSFQSVPNWNSFSSYDIIAAQTLYPYSLYDNWINDVSPFAGYGDSDLHPEITWNSNLVSSSTVSIEIYQYGVSKGIIASNIPNNGSFIGSNNYRYYLQPSTHDYFYVQLKIISDDNPSINDMTKAFNFFWD